MTHISVGGRASPRRAAKWGAGLALAIILALAFISLQLFQLTSESVSRPALRRALNALVEGNAVVERNYDDLRARAEAAPDGETLELRDYPVSVPLTRDEVLESSPESLRLLLLERGVERIYDEGTGVLRADGGSDAGRFTAAGAVDEFMGFLREDVHGTLAVVTLILAGLSVVAGAAVVALCRGFGRAVAVGLVTVIAAIPVVGGGLLVRASSESSGSGGEYLRSELMEIASNLSWLPLRNGLAVGALGLIVLIVGVAGARFSAERESF